MPTQQQQYEAKMKDSVDTVKFWLMKGFRSQVGRCGLTMKIPETYSLSGGGIGYGETDSEWLLKKDAWLLEIKNKSSWNDFKTEWPTLQKEVLETTGNILLDMSEIAFERIREAEINDIIKHCSGGWIAQMSR
tara:strand:+ start:245 stop:643 length:399 start_codon:yes stop_codon:yes gene_type:complete